MKRAIFLVHRTMYYRYYTPLIKEAFLRGYDVEAWHDYGYPKECSKGRAFPDIAYTPKLLDNVIKTRVFTSNVVFFDNQELKSNLMALGDNDVVFSLHQPFLYWRNGMECKFPFRWIALHHAIDDFFEFVNNKESRSFSNATFVVFTNKWIDKGREFINRFSGQRSLEVFDSLSTQVTGQPEFDSFADVGNPELVRNKYGIPKGKKILLYLPFPYQNWNPKSAWERAFAGLGMNTLTTKKGFLDHKKKKPFFKKILSDVKDVSFILRDPEAFAWWRRGITEDRAFKAIKEFARRNDLFLVIKPRLKFPISEYIKKNADLFVFDDETQNNPPVLKELLSLASLAVSYYSLSVLSAAFVSVYHLNIITSDSFFPDEKGRYFFPDKAPSVFNYPGVSRSLTAQEVISKIASMDLKDFVIDKDRRAEYVKDYIGFDDYNSSKRIFDLL